MKINNHFKESIYGTGANFVNFVKINCGDIQSEDLLDIDYLAQKVAVNMFYFPDNVETAKSDYISLLGLLIKKGVIFTEHKDLVPDHTYPYTETTR